MNRYIFIAATVLLSSCATAYQERAATQGAVVGATAGAVVGAQSDRIFEDAIIGAVLGGLIGAVLADDRDDRIHASEARYHRRSCSKGNVYFNKASRARDLDMRISLMRQGVRHCPSNPAAHNDLGVALMLWGDSAGARLHFNHALRLDPGYYPAKRNMARMVRYHAPKPRVEHRRNQREIDRDEYRQHRRDRLIRHERTRGDYIESREKYERQQKKRLEENEGYD